jgi:N-acetylglucosaminyl-diphospho-decaprenol L-rhamnosyltransferase
MREVGIVIVTHNSALEIGACLDAAMSTGAELIVIDNASSDGTVGQVRQRGAAIVANPVNRGFAAAANQGIRLVSANYILLLNPDAVLQGSLEPLRAACARPGAAAAGGKLLDVHGSAQAGFSVRRLPTPLVLAFEVLLVNRVWPGNRANWHYRCYDLNYDEPAEVEQPAGAFLMIRRQVWEDLGGLDEQFYPVWFEDVDFCKRVRDLGYHVYYEPGAVAVHLGGHSIQKILLEKRELYWYGSLLKYGFKHFRSGSSRFLCLAVIFGSLMRMAIGTGLQRSFRPVQVYARVMKLAARYLLFGPDRMGVGCERMF